MVPVGSQADGPGAMLGIGRAHISRYDHHRAGAIDPSASYNAPVVSTLQVEPQGPSLYPALYRGVVQGNILYITEQDTVNGNSNLELIDISSPAAPAKLSKTAGSGAGMNGIAVNGQYVYVSYWKSSVVQVFDATNPSSPTPVGSVTTACNSATNKGLYGALVISGHYLYAPCANPALSPPFTTGFIDVINIANHASPSEVGQITAQNMTNPTSLAASGQVLYASEPSEADGSGGHFSAVCAYSLAGGPVPAAPVSCASVGHSPQNIAVQGTTVAASIGDDDELDIVDFSNPVSPNVYSAALDPSICVHPYVENMVAFQGSTVFVGCSNSPFGNTEGNSGPGYGVEAVDVTNITAPTLLGTLLGSSGNSFATIVPNGSYLYLGGYPGQDGTTSSTAGVLYTVDTGEATITNITFLPTSLSFASQTIETTSAAQSVTLSNTGTAAITINGITITGTNPSDFAQANTCGTSVAANASCSISVTFTPTAAGARSGSLSVSDNASGSPQTVPLYGTGATTQTPAGVIFNAIGSPALYLETGEAAAQELQTLISGTNYQCLWTGGSGALVATDPTTGQSENGRSWIAWSIDTVDDGTSCANPGTSPQIYSYLQSDSVIGTRCLFNGCIIINSASGGATLNSVFQAPCTLDGSTPNEEVCTLPASIAAYWGSGLPVSAAGTDMRPEDAEFATLRALAPCGLPFPINSAEPTRFLGLGYTSGGASISSFYSSGSFHVTSFTLPAGGYTAYRIGAAPIVVHINQTDGTALGAGAAGFADTSITNIDSASLAGFLDGSRSRTQDLPGATGSSQGVTVLIREPLSGTYNTMELNVSNTSDNQTSMDVGENQTATQQNCAGPLPKSNPMDIATKAGARTRVIGSSEMENVMFGTGSEAALPFPAVLGWSSWSEANFKNAYSGKANFNADARYLMVDGVDPLQSTFTGGVIPTAGNGLLAGVTMSHVIDGSYPIWSFLRLVCAGNGSSAACTAAGNLAKSAQNYVALGASADALHPPDFVPVASSTRAWNSQVIRSHFMPAGIGSPCGPVANGTGPRTGPHAAPECGGDVGGVVYTIQGDLDFETDFQSGIGVKQVGEINRRR